MIQTERDAKGFLVAAILAQASREGLVLSANELWMLRFSESDPEFAVDPERIQEFESGISDAAYEEKVVGLLRRAYEHDRRMNSDAATTYREARDCLGRGDHYLLVMFDQALASRPQGGATSRLARAASLLIVLPAAILAMVSSGGLAVILVTGQTQTMRETLAVASGAALFAGMSWYLIRLLIRHRRA